MSYYKSGLFFLFSGCWFPPIHPLKISLGTNPLVKDRFTNGTNMEKVVDDWETKKEKGKTFRSLVFQT